MTAIDSVGLGFDAPEIPFGATENEDGTLELAISFGGACEEINCKVGDTLVIQLITKE